MTTATTGFAERAVSHVSGNRHSFLSLQNIGGAVRSRGLHYCFLGHKIERQGSMPDGVFVEWLWNGETLEARNDRYGIFPLYYFARAGEICLSPSLLTLLELGAPSEIDEEAMAAFIRIGFFLGTDTPFAQIRTLPPNAVLTWTEGKLTVSGNIPISKAREATRDEIIDHFIELFRLSIAKRKPSTPDFVVPLSGGRDSRHIAFELHAQGFTPKFCATIRYAPPSSSEDEIAATICNGLRFPHRVFGPPELSVALELKKNRQTNFSTFEHAWAQALYDEIRHETTTIYDGAGGDVLSAALFNSPERIEMYESGRVRQFAEGMLRNEGELQLLLADDKYRRLSRELACQRLVRELEIHRSAPNPVASFFFFNRTRRVTAIVPFTIMHELANAYLPYLDHGVFDFLMSFRGEMFIDYALHTDAIRRAYPQYAHIPFSAKAKIPASQQDFRRFAFQILKFGYSQSTQWVRRAGHVPRLLRCIIDARYGESVTWLSFLPLYLYELERAVRGIAEHRKQTMQELKRGFGR